MNFEELPLVKNTFESSNTIKTDKGDLLNNFTAIIEKNGNITLKFQPNVFTEKGESFNIDFVDKNGWTTKIEGCCITAINAGLTIGKPIESGVSGIYGEALYLNSKTGILNNNEVSVFKIISNMPFSGDKVYNFNNINIRRIIEFTPSEIKNIMLINGVNVFLDNSSGFFYYQCPYDEIDSYDKYILHIQELLDFGSAKFVEIPLTYIIQKEDYKEIRYKAKQEELLNGFEIINMHLPGRLSSYINKCYEPYKRKKASLGLANIFAYYVLMTNASILDIKFLLGSVLMEGLKYFFAKNVKHYNQNSKGYFINNSKKGATYSFEELLNQIYNEFGLTKGYDKFIEYRNEIIHTGHLDYLWPDKIEMMQKFNDFISVLLLKILEYDGDFYSFEKLKRINVNSVTF